MVSFFFLVCNKASEYAGFTRVLIALRDACLDLIPNVSVCLSTSLFASEVKSSGESVEQEEKETKMFQPILKKRSEWH